MYSNHLTGLSNSYWKLIKNQKIKKNFMFTWTQNGTCHDWMFTCHNKMCIPEWWTCDMADDCGDGSDELDCSLSPNKNKDGRNPGALICEQNQFRCSSGECIAQSWVCDGSRDCANGDDELNCETSTRCTNTEFKCRVDGSCISVSVKIFFVVVLVKFLVFCFFFFIVQGVNWIF